MSYSRLWSIIVAEAAPFAVHSSGPVDSVQGVSIMNWCGSCDNRINSRLISSRNALFAAKSLEHTAEGFYLRVTPQSSDAADDRLESTP